MKKDLLRLPLAKMLFLTAVLSATLLLQACGDDAEGRVEINSAAPAQVSNVQTAAGPGEVYLTWTMPSSSSFMYAKVEYKNSKGEGRILYVTKEKADANGQMSATISGFANTDPVDFEIYACSVRGNHAGALKVTAAPGTPAFIQMLNSVEVEPAMGGVNVSWKNEAIAPVIISLEYQKKDDAALSGSYKFEVPANSEDTRFVRLLCDKGAIAYGDCVINVTTQDAEANTSDVKTYEAALNEVHQLDRSDWSIPGFADTYDATIGYSSQEVSGEGAYPNGRVVALIDGNENTFWHTAWRQASAYPHFVIVDMGKDMDISMVSLRRRTGNNGTNKGQSFYTCSDDKAVNKDNPDSWTWTGQGTFSFDANTDDYQFFELQNPQKARYLKVYFAESDQGNTTFVMLSELNIYGIE